MNRRIGRQRGFLGLIVLLIALLIVAWLSMDALKEYGVMSGVGPTPKAAPAAEPARGPGIARHRFAGGHDGHAGACECAGQGAWPRKRGAGAGGGPVAAHRRGHQVGPVHGV